MRFGVFLIGQQIGVRSAAEGVAAVIAGAEQAQRLGLEVCWLAEHHFPRYGSFGSAAVALAAIAARTSTIRIGSAVAVVPLHNPLRLAEDLALVDLISGGRLIAGV